MKLNQLKAWAFNYNDDDRRRQTLLFDRLKPGDIFIDCGANTGQETIPALRKGAIVYAFEPHPQAFASLKKNVGNLDRAHLINKGVWDRQSKLKLYLHKKHLADALAWSTGASLVREKENVDTSKFVEVEVIDLAQFIDQLAQPIKAVKIDVEGVEFDILARLIDRGSDKKVDSILVETHADKMPQLRARETEIKKLIAKKKITNISLDWV